MLLNVVDKCNSVMDIDGNIKFKFEERRDCEVFVF